MIKYSREVEQALKEKQAVIALESTIIAHGMPYPENLHCALDLEAIARSKNVVPATIAMFEGEIHVGLEKEQIELIAEKGSSFKKLSIRDLAWARANKLNGAFTVATTLFAAQQAGIRVFATGGVGGVHRGAGTSFDVSADLIQLSKSQLALISAGAKAILDLSATLEYLETLGVPVYNYQCEEFPAFYTRKSGLVIHQQIQSAEEFPALLQAQIDLGLDQGILIANPIPEDQEADYALIQDAIEKALQEADEKSLRSAEITPFLLRRISEISSAESLAANLALVKNNVLLGSEFALAWAKHQRTL
jgi:pseudouridine-5'-phosphate glycosidase